MWYSQLGSNKCIIYSKRLVGGRCMEEGLHSILSREEIKGKTYLNKEFANERR
jgi:hypothetical protein